MSIKYKFPKDFWWGSAASATQTEGAGREDDKGLSIWDLWYEKEPDRFFQGISSEVASDFYHKYKEDIKLMKEIGHNSFRFSISWSRLIPDGTGRINEKAVAFYNNVINELIKNDIEPFVTLYHFDMPLEMQYKGGWESREVVDAYSEYAKTCFKLFSDRVKVWITHNEPIVPVEGGYLHDFHYPNIVDFKRGIQVGFNTMVSHCKAVKEFKSLNIQNGKIGIVLNLTPSYPRSSNIADLEAANIADLIYNRSFLDPVVKGEYPKELIALFKENDLLPCVENGDKELIKNNLVDFLGVNYYMPRRVKAKENMPNPNAPMMPETFFDNYEMPGRKMNVYRGWEIYEKGIYDIMINLKNNYGNIECYVSENGMGVENEERFVKDGIIDDSYRIDFVKEHLKWLHKSIQEGCNIKGYHMWTFIDSWSWSNAYKNRYGFVQLDLKTQKRTLKKSAYWIKEVSKNNGF
ncbi:glycoside hydrolase family 1 protein [Clostridium sp. JS66]|uniref:glycoside hydrolase family 1 protein n=1 Tax=Clostridium sp. JS66 TaxID=3064705 RepID=UPI00298E18B3|nr:glycoside hydrolase family 1 protein [Clostridium sp. JS66]WPC39204.1 glycoside hydrolase family 1 protein [Clostridium sp. JS66]